MHNSNHIPKRLTIALENLKTILQNFDAFELISHFMSNISSMET